MFNYRDGEDHVRSLMEFSASFQSMVIAAGEVVFRRSLMMASGTMGGPGAANMVVEKATTFAEAAAGATIAFVTREDPIAVATAALEPYGTRTAANVRELRG